MSPVSSRDMAGRRGAREESFFPTPSPPPSGVDALLAWSLVVQAPSPSPRYTQEVLPKRPGRNVTESEHFLFGLAERERSRFTCRKAVGSAFGEETTTEAFGGRGDTEETSSSIVHPAKEKGEAVLTSRDPSSHRPWNEPNDLLDRASNVQEGSLQDNVDFSDWRERCTIRRRRKLKSPGSKLVSLTSAEMLLLMEAVSEQMNAKEDELFAHGSIDWEKVGLQLGRTSEECEIVWWEFEPSDYREALDLVVVEHLLPDEALKRRRQRKAQCPSRAISSAEFQGVEDALANFLTLNDFRDAMEGRLAKIVEFLKNQRMHRSGDP